MSDERTRRWFERRTEPPCRPLFAPPRSADPVPAGPSPSVEQEALGAALVEAHAIIGALEARVALAESSALDLQARAASAEQREAEAREVDAAHAAALEARATAAAALFEDRLVALAFAIARKVVGRELASAPELLVDWAREALAESGLTSATLVVAPHAAARFDAVWTETPVDFDADLAADACELRTDTQAVDVSAEARVDAAFDHVNASVAREAA